ncbi:uncharacterized protein PHALS_02967 [Plasmopara halstedii]|uniref:Uncharacterized protein n=1 Tax=Plasmopara halstedii TaxID=4781 RepID=A0A0N7L7B0_PLAHL|nr:uncharacterized protein PHALS_02967 [Plasmopara halstedii]CEG46571.1 hypothetical protein PHALS_02967 [Plasmopara halstedii]|eukprot:XP_024582940.1 hypothetical protein PHALS_02967 [Plasmopara halstedii]
MTSRRNFHRICKDCQLKKLRVGLLKSGINRVTRSATARAILMSGPSTLKISNYCLMAARCAITDLMRPEGCPGV